MAESPQPLLSHSDSVKFASIDIGTNAVRLLLSRVLENNGDPFVKKESLVRIPIRLGEDVFSSGVISDQKRRSLLHTMVAYQNLMQAYGPIDYIACATSAMREAENGAEVVAEICDRTGIEVTMIDGRREAELICRNRPQRGPARGNPFLYVDVGGGSTEVAIFAENRIVESHSFKIGGVRILAGRVDEAQRKEMKRWVKQVTRPYQPIVAIGSGGNINKAFRLARRKEGESVSFKKLNSIYRELRRHSAEELIHIYRMRPDRADVIVPALDIYLSVMRWARVKEMLVPLQGLSDGLVHFLYEKYRNGGAPPPESDIVDAAGISPPEEGWPE